MNKGKNLKDVFINIDVVNADEYQALVKDISDKVHELEVAIDKANDFKLKVGVGEEYIDVQVPPIVMEIEF